MIKCPKCGKENADNAKGCTECGADFSKKPAKSKSSNTTIIIAVVAIIVIIAIVGIVASGMLSGNSNDNVASQSDSKVVSPIVDNSSSNATNKQNESSTTSGEYWASAKTDKFHLPTCEWAEKISDNNKVVYHSREDAIADGKQPCSVCNP